MLVSTMQSREITGGFIVPLINYYVVIDKEDGISLWSSAWKYRGNKVLWLITNIISWLFHITADETYSEVEDTFVFTWYLCVLGFYIHICEQYTYIEESSCSD